MAKKVVRLTHDLNWGYRLEPIISEVADVVSLTAKSKDEAVEAAKGAEMLLVTSLGQRNLFTPDTIARLDSVKVLYVTGVGWDPIDPAACTKKGILLANNPEFCTHEVAEHTLTLILSLMRKLPFAHQAVKENGWAEFHGFHAHSPAARQDSRRGWFRAIRTRGGAIAIRLGRERAGIRSSRRYQEGRTGSRRRNGRIA